MIMTSFANIKSISPLSLLVDLTFVTMKIPVIYVVSFYYGIPLISFVILNASCSAPAVGFDGICACL